MHPHDLCVSSYNYDQWTGELTRKDGYPVLTVFDTDYFDGNGRITIEYFGKATPATHVIWYWMTGKFPERGLVIDHVDRDPSNNRWRNLRKCTIRENCQNCNVNTEYGKKFLAHVNIGTESIELGWYNTKEERDKVVEFAYNHPDKVVTPSLDDLLNL